MRWISSSALLLSFFSSALCSLACATESLSSCNVTMVEVPRCTAPNQCLTAPPHSSRPVIVLLGVGTQNFTCTSTSNTTSELTAMSNGAKANLYDITCSALHTPTSALENFPKLSMLTRITNVASLSGLSSVPHSLGFRMVGHHFFSPTAATPVLEVETDDKKVKFVGKRLEGVAAPLRAMNMSADWLKLGLADGEENKEIQFVYRVNVAGGKPSANVCKGKEPGEEVTALYAAQYWLLN